MVNRRGQVVEESLEEFEVGDIERCGTQRIDLGCCPLKAVRIATGEDYPRSFAACSSGGFESDAGAAADQNHGLPGQLRFTPYPSSSRRGAHDSSYPPIPNLFRLFSGAVFGINVRNG